MKKLLKLHGFNSDMQYFEMIVATKIAGNHMDANVFFKAMPKSYRVKFVQMAITHWKSGLTNPQISTLVQYI